MTIETDDIIRLSQSVCETMLQLPAGEEEANVPDALSSPHSAFTRVSGAWNGLISIDCPAMLARRAAAVMFDLPLGELSPADMRDGVLELANVVGGNIKALLPEPSRLSIPSEATGDLREQFPTMTLTARIEIPVEGKLLVVTVLSEAA